MKMKLKVTTALLVSLFLVSVIAVSTHAKPTDTNRLLMIDIMAKGDDLDIPGATVTTTIIARIEFDKVSGEALQKWDGYPGLVF
jgi:Spy/CpxP family protein refolding chaperone